MPRTSSSCLPTLLIGMLLAACAPATDNTDAEYAAATGAEQNVTAVTIDGYQPVLELFAELGYTPAAWQAGIREVPRIYLREISDRWSKVTTQEIDVPLKKQLFFRVIGPLTLRSNELILAEREQLKTLRAAESISAEQLSSLKELAERYGLDPMQLEQQQLLEELWLRVDIVPASLILAQAAEESGWGTSRFAFTGNALFGQWTWDGEGIVPEQQRAGKGDYRIAAFDSPLQSVQAHARNLNSHRAYAEFRTERAKLRQQNKALSGTVLAGTLSRYSERGADYVKTLRGIIDFNRLEPVDDAFLSDQAAIVLVREAAAED